MSAQPNLHLVDTGLLVNPATGETVDASYTIQDLTDQNAGLLKTVESQSRMIGSLNRKLSEFADPDHQPANSEVIALIKRWQTLCHPKATVSKDRVKLVKARLADGFAIASEDFLPAAPTLELAVDGIASHPYLLYGKRKRSGADSNRYDDLKDAIGEAAKVEESARAGYLARKSGWTLETGWPE